MFIKLGYPSSQNVYEYNTPFWLKLVAPVQLCGSFAFHYASATGWSGEQSSSNHVDFTSMDLPQTDAGVPVPNIDPTVDELAGYNSLAQIYQWLGMSEASRAGFIAALGGGNPPLRDVVYTRGPDWDAAMETVRVAVDGGDPRPPNCFERGHYAMVRRIARLRLGLTAVEVRAAGVVPGAVAAPGAMAENALALAGPAPPANPEPKIKLNLLIDPALDSELVRLPQSRIRELFAKYEDVRGDEPSEDVEPTTDQISALSQLFTSDMPPYADFSIWGPYGKRMLGKLQYQAWNFQPDGTWHRRELPGPPTFEHWWLSYRVLRTTTLLLEMAPPEHLDNYGEMVRTFATKYGPTCWWLVYQADVRMRSEHFERLRRAAERGTDPKIKFNPAKPWFNVYKMAIDAKLWWDEHLHQDAVLFLTRVKTAAETMDDGTVQPALQAQEGLGAGNTRRRSRSNPRPRQRAEAFPTDSQGNVYTRGGVAFCNDYNTPKGCNRKGCRYQHSCKLCRGTNHGQHKCSQGKRVDLRPNSGAQRHPPPPPVPHKGGNGSGNRRDNHRSGNGRR